MQLHSSYVMRYYCIGELTTGKLIPQWQKQIDANGALKYQIPVIIFIPISPHLETQTQLTPEADLCS